MGFFDIFSRTDKRHAHVAMVVTLAHADGHVATEETAYVALVADKLGLDLNDLKKAVRMGADEAASHMATMSKGEKAVVLADCIRCSVIDGEMDAKENAFNAMLGTILGINGDDFTTVLGNLDKPDHVLQGMF